MAAPRRCLEEVKERAATTTLVAPRSPATKPEAINRIADQLGIHPEALHRWMRAAEIGAGQGARATTADAHC